MPGMGEEEAEVRAGGEGKGPMAGLRGSMARVGVDLLLAEGLTSQDFRWVTHGCRLGVGRRPTGEVFQQLRAACCSHPSS